MFNPQHPYFIPVVDLTTLSVKLKKYSDGVLQSVPAAMREVSLSIISDVKERVISRGQAADGSMFSPYSTRTMLVGRTSFKTAQAFNAFVKEGKESKGLKGKKGVKMTKTVDWRTIKRGGQTYRLMLLEGGYKKLRELHGHPTSKKIFYWDGTMLNSVFPKDPVQSGYRFSSVYGPNIERELLKMSGLQSREGKKLLAPSEQEKQRGREIFFKLLNK